MAKKNEIINILTYRLDGAVARQIYNEYQDRLREANFLIQNYKTYSKLQENQRTVELILALSIFHKRVIAAFDAASNFYGTVNHFIGNEKESSKSIRIGSLELDAKERNKMLGIIIAYSKLIQEYSIPDWVLDYSETRELLKKLIALKENDSNPKSDVPVTTRKGDDGDGLPF